MHGDAYKTLFVYRLNYKTDEKRLQRKFEFYGPIKRIRLVKDLSGNSRGYAFIEYEHKSDFSNAYKRGDRERIDDKIVYTDFERGRTEKGFRPRRFGGHFPQETRPLPAWLLKDLKTFKEHHPDIVEEIKTKYAPVKEVKENKNYETKESKENKEFEGVTGLANGNNSRSRSRERENKDKDKEREKDRDRERARKHRSKSRSRSRSRSRDKKKSKRHNLSPTPKRDLSNLIQANNTNYNQIENLDENNYNILSSKENLNQIDRRNNDANMMPNGSEGGEIKDANGNGNYNKGNFLSFQNFKFIKITENEEDSDYTDRRRSKKEKKEKKDKKHKKDKKSKKDKKEKKEKKEKRERKESVEVGEIV